MVELTRAIASFVADTGGDEIPRLAVDKAKRAITDTIGVILGGAASECAPPLLRYAARSGAGTSPIFGTPLAASPEVAALVNGTFAHAMDFDDVMPVMPGHPSAVIVPGLLAGGRVGEIDGRSLLDAYIVGVEIGAKLGLAIGTGHYFSGWHATGTLGIFGGVAALARLLRLDAQAIAHAIGLASSMASGVQRNYGTMAKPLHAGWAARSSVAAVELASAGLRAAPDALEGKDGFFSLYGDSRSDPGRVLGQFGQPYAILDPGLSLKKYPCAYPVHRPIDGMLELRERYGISVENVDSVSCLVPPGSLKALIYPRPETGLQAKFSMEYAVAATLLDGKVTLGSFTDEAVNRQEIRQLLPRIRKGEDPRCSAEDPLAETKGEGGRGFIEVHVTTRQGEHLMTRVDKPVGSPERELSWDDLQQKFLDCASLARIDPGRSTEALEILRSLEQAPDLSRLVSLLHG